MLKRNMAKLWGVLLLVSQSNQFSLFKPAFAGDQFLARGTGLTWFVAGHSGGVCCRLNIITVNQYFFILIFNYLKLNMFILEIQVTYSSSMYFCTSHLMMHVVIFGMLFNKTRQYNIYKFSIKVSFSSIGHDKSKL